MVRDNDWQEDSAENGSRFSRRRWLQAFGIGTTGVMAGCLSGDGGGDGDSTDAPTASPTDSPTETEGDGTPEDTPTETPRPTVTDPRDDTLDWVTSYGKERHGYNSYNPTTGAVQEYAVMQSRLARLDIAEQQWIARLAEDWHIGQEESTITLSEDYKWSNGDPITAEDMFTQFGISYFGPSENPEITSLEIVEGGPGGTVRWGQRPGTNLSIRTESRLNYGLTQPESVYGEWLEQMRDASDTEAKEEVRKELEEWRYAPPIIGGEHEPEEILSSGPFHMTEMTNKRIVFEPNPHHPVGQSYNFNVEFRWTKDTNAEKPMMKSNETDVSREELSPQFLETLPNNWKTVYFPAFGGNSIDFLLDHELYGRRNVRRALNFMVDQDQVGKANPTPATGVTYHTGMADFISESWLSDDLLNSLSRYNQDFDKAESLLKEEGFTLDGDTWKTPSGETWEIEVELPAGNTNRIKETEVATQQMSDFGVEANIKISEGSTYWSTYRSGDWPSGIKFWAFGDRGRPHPIYDYYYVYIGGGKYEDNPERDPELPWNHQPFEVEVPYPVGDPDGDLEEVDFYDLISSANEAQTREEEEEIVSEMAWVWNQFMPKMPTTNTIRMVHYTDDDWIAPNEDYVSALRSSKVANSLREGRLTARPK